MASFIMTEITQIPLEQTGHFSSLMLDYVNKSDALRDLYGNFFDLPSFKAQIEKQAEFPVDRELLVSVLKEQYQNIGVSDVNSRINSLANENTFTVCTGHQLCLYTGPMYFIFKIVSTIRLSQKLKEAYPEYEFVPVYWMASEDNDFEEVSSVNVFSKEIVWDNKGAGGAVGRMKTDTIESSLKELEAIVGDTENAKRLISFFKDAYLKQKNLADATRLIVHTLFLEYGLLIVDGDNAQLKKKFVPILKNDLQANTNYNLVQEASTKLSEKGYKVQVNPRKINCFYIVGDVRERIVKEGEEYKVLNTSISFSEESLLDELEKHPEHFSPNVVLRPMYQQTLLPNLAYVGGPGEIAYWLEYKSMFEKNEVCYPILFPRNFATLVHVKTKEQLSKLGIAFQDIFLDTDLLIKKYVSFNTSAPLSLKEEEKELEAFYHKLKIKASEVDATLAQSVESELAKSLKSLKTIEAKILRSEKRKHEESIDKIRAIKEKYIPNGTLQERVENFIPYYLQKGNGCIEELMNSFEPFDVGMNLIEI